MDAFGTISFLESFKPIHEFRFGHTPFQVQYFKTSSQAGCREFEYWQHCLQLRQFYRTLRDIELDIHDVELTLEEACAWWPLWNRAKRRHGIPRLEWRLQVLRESYEDSRAEAQRHIDVLQKQFGDLLGLSEAEIMTKEPEYWTQRLTRQIAAAKAGQHLGIPVGELVALASLPPELQTRILNTDRLRLGGTDE
jgi:hypothetical protein